MPCVIQIYQNLIHQGVLVPDTVQQHAVSLLAQRARALQAELPMTGLYLHGRVGRGKTLLMDLFFEQLETPQKLRLHLHHFMLLIHQKLKEIQGRVNPLSYIAQELAANTKVICFDEFFVNDIADAMLLGGIFDALNKQGVMIIATSNTAPDDLYAGGLARDRFLPTIDLIKAHLHYFPLDGDLDYRTTFTQLNSVYFCKNRAAFEQYLTHKNVPLDCPSVITLYGRDLHVKGRSSRTIWFDFMALCDGPRSQNDYMLLADSYDVLVISDVVQLGGKVTKGSQVKGIEDGDTNYLITPASALEIGHLDDCARRFIALVDEFYDRQKLIVISSDIDMLSLYQGGRVIKQFSRTYSRLTQMQSVDYQNKTLNLNDSVADSLFATIER